MRVILFLLLISNSFALHATFQTLQAARKLLIIDTNGDQKYNYRNTILLAESVGFQVDFINLYELLESKQISGYQNVLIFISSSLIQNLNTTLGQKIIKILENLSTQSNKYIGILLPSVARATPQVMKKFEYLLEKCGVFKNIVQDPRHAQEVKTTYQRFLKHILQHDLNIGSLYGTTLFNQNTNPFVKFDYHQDSMGIIKFWPDQTQFSGDISQTLPAALYVKNETIGNSYIISKESVFNFADINENFFKCPFDVTVRNKLLMVPQQILLQFYNIIGLHNHKSVKATAQSLPKEFTMPFIIQEKKQAQKKMSALMCKNKHYSWVCKQGISCAWLEVTDFFAGDAQKKKDHSEESSVDQGAAFLIDAGFNMLWFEFNPEVYLSINAKDKQGLPEFKRKITAIANALKNKAKQKGKPMPKIFIGTDITTNFGKMPVKHATKDVYGVHYSKIPCPTDVTFFWQPEVIEVFEKFYTMFKDILPIDGIFFDFEMYHAQDQAGAYTNQMDFSDLSWQLYCQHTHQLSALQYREIKDRVQFLSKTKQFGHYFIVLKHKAREIGNLIKQKLTAIKPDLVFGAYTITLPNSWFYQGLFAGLSSPKSPIILATFNIDYYSHYQWLIQNDIYVFHAAPLMLSKFKTKEDFALIDYLLQFHDFVWYNRPSRMIHKKRDGQSWSIEASQMDLKEVADGVSAKSPAH